MSKRTLAVVGLAVALSVGFGGIAGAQDDAPSVSGPDGMPPEIASMLGHAESAGAQIAVAPSEEPADADASTPGALAGSRYLYTTLRVINNGSPRGCGYGDWNCMTGLCRSDLQDNSAWRGWAGCWRRDSWICYFECGQRRNAF